MTGRCWVVARSQWIISQMTLSKDVAKTLDTLVTVIRPAGGLVTSAVVFVLTAVISPSSKAKTWVTRITAFVVVANNSNSCPWSNIIYVESLFVTASLQGGARDQPLPSVTPEMRWSICAVSDEGVQWLGFVVETDPVGDPTGFQPKAQLSEWKIVIGVEFYFFVVKSTC